MDGPHDLGGAHGLGPIEPEPEAREPAFHAEWERDAMALTLAAAALGRWNIDMVRYARERQHPVDYLGNSYYENWLAGLETLLLETGVLTADELATGRAAGLAEPDLRERVLRAAEVPDAIARGRPAGRPVNEPPRFTPGDRVRVRVSHPTGHTRAPRYVRGRSGTVHEHYGGHVFPDQSVRGCETGAHLYSVRFEAQALWGGDASAPGAVYVDLWEPYLEPA